MRRATYGFGLGATIASFVLVFACGSDGDSSFGDGRNGIGNGDDDASSGFAPTGDSGSNGGGNGDASCASTLAETKLEPLDIYFVLDRSGSMGSDCAIPSSGTSKWCYASNALASYFQSSAATGHRAALQYFTLENWNCTTGAPHHIPAIGLTDLPVAGGSPLITNLVNAGPVTGLGTRIESALRGIATFTSSNRTAGRTMVGVFITDGDPQNNGAPNCSTSDTTLRGVVENHLNGSAPS